MSHKEKHKNIPVPLPGIFTFFQRRLVIVILLGLVCLIGLPMRMQNMKLDGYISDDAWWHYRHVKEVVEFGHRLNPDIYEFATLSRPMTYQPLFHYVAAYAYKIFGRGLSLIQFTHYFNLIEAILYILLIYGISCLLSADRLFSVIGALGVAVSYGMIIRARAGELMPFVLGDLLAFGAVLILLIFVKGILQNKKNIWLCIIAGIFMGLSLLSWSGGVYIYLPLVLFIFIALTVERPHLGKEALKLFLLCFAAILIICLPWYLPLILKYGLNPHSKEMAWFMKGFTVLRQVKPPIFYIFTSGIPIFFIPLVFLVLLFKREASSIFFNLWIVLGAVSTYVGWRGYVAVVPVISAIAISIGLSQMAQFFFKEKFRYVLVLFTIAFLLLATFGYHISRVKIAPLDPRNPNEVRTNEKSVKMLKFLKSNYPRAVTVDHITWMSEDEAVGDLRIMAGQYLEYLPAGSSEALKDISRIYISDEENAYKLCQKYNVDLIILRKQFLQLPQLSLLFAPPELKSEDYLKVTKEKEEGNEITVSFTPKGIESMLFRMLSRQKLEKFELVYADADNTEPIPFLAVYKPLKD